MPTLHCPACKKAFQVADPPAGTSMPSYSCPQCKKPLTASAQVASASPAAPQAQSGGGWLVPLLLVVLVNVVFLLLFFQQDSAVKQAALAALQTACTLALFVVLYCIKQMGGRD